MSKKKNQSFEEQFNRLEEIVDILDSGEEPIERLIEYYEEGITLTKSLKEFLEKAEQKIVEISK